MSEFTYSISTNNALYARALLTIAQMMNSDEVWDDEVLYAVFFVLDIFKDYVKNDKWIGAVNGVEAWKGRGKTLRELADVIGNQVANYEKARRAE